MTPPAMAIRWLSLVRCFINFRHLGVAVVRMNIVGLGDPVGFESLQEGRASQLKLASLSFDAAGFGHGKPIARDASTHFRNKWCKKSPA